MGYGRAWSREELLVAFGLYCRLPFGQLQSRNREIVRVSGLMGRTPSAVSMKACNFASFDPVHQARGIVGLKNASRADGELFAQFLLEPDEVAIQVERAWDEVQLSGGRDSGEPTFQEVPDGPSEVERVVRTRRLQRFFRSSVLASYEGRCALTGLAVPGLLNASHIVPWSADEHRRADPRNGLCLNALHDRAFDRGLITIDDSMRIVVSDRLRSGDPERLPDVHRRWLLEIEGTTLRAPHRFTPDAAALTFHREHVFDKAG